MLSSSAVTLTCAAHPSADVARAPRPAGAETLLVIPFENTSRVAKLDWLGEGFAELAAERLARTELEEGLRQNPAAKQREDARQLLERLERPASAAKPPGGAR